MDSEWVWYKYIHAISGKIPSQQQLPTEFPDQGAWSIRLAL